MYLPVVPRARCIFHSITCCSDISLPASMKRETSLHCRFLEEFPSQHFPKCLSGQHNWKMHCKCFSDVTWTDNATLLVTGETNTLIFYYFIFFNISLILKKIKKLKHLKISRNVSRHFASYFLHLSIFLFWGKAHWRKII